MTRSRRRAGSQVLIVIAFLASLGSCDSLFGCKNDEITRVHSPDGKLDVVLYMRECGATTDFSTQVSVVPAGGELPHAPANVFISVADGAEPRASWGGPPAAIEWQGDRSIVVRYHSKSTVLRSIQQVNVPMGWFVRASVTINYTMLEDVAEPPSSAVDAPHLAVTARASSGTRRAVGWARYRGRWADVAGGA